MIRRRAPSMGENQIEDIPDGSEVIEPFDPTKIRVEAKIVTIDSLLKRLRYNEINLSPSFQRNSDVWNEDTRSRFIESLLVRIPVPSFYFDATNEDKWVVVDGLQRLTALKKFVIDNSLVLEGLEYLVDFNGKRYSDLSRKYQRRIEETQVTAIQIEKGTPENVMYNIFRRINTGGEPLSPQEIRHALYQGSGTELIKAEAMDTLFNSIMHADNKRMGGCELVLRAFAYLVFKVEEAIRYNYDELLVNALKELNRKSPEELNNLRVKFRRGLKSAKNIFGEYVYRKRSKPNDRKNPINKTLYETWTVCLGSLEQKSIDKLVSQKELVNKNFISLMVNDRQFMTAISSGKPTAIRYRYKKILELIEKLL